MAPRKALGRGLEDRIDSSAIRARVRRTDKHGTRHDLNQNFPYDPAAASASPYSRAAAVSKARAWAAEQQRVLRMDGLPVGTRMEDQTLEGWVRRFIDEATEGADVIKRGLIRKVPEFARKKWIQKDIYMAQCWINECPKLMAKNPADITHHDINHEIDFFRYRRMDQDGNQRILKPQTIIRRLMVLSSVFRAAAKEWKFDIANPVARADRPRANAAHEHEREGQIVTNEQLSRIMQELRGASPVILAILPFLRWTGARRSEAVNLLWSDVDLGGNIPTATFRGTKDPMGRNRSRTIPLSPEAVAALAPLMREGKPAEGRVFPITPDASTRAWDRGRDRAGLGHLRLHDLRHTRSTEVTADLDLMEAKAITGHRDTRMLDRYYHPDPQRLGKKLLAEQAKRTAEVASQSNAVVGKQDQAKRRLTAAQKMKQELAFQLLREAGLPVPED